MQNCLRAAVDKESDITDRQINRPERQMVLEKDIEFIESILLSLWTEGERRAWKEEAWRRQSSSAPTPFAHCEAICMRRAELVDAENAEREVPFAYFCSDKTITIRIRS